MLWRSSDLPFEISAGPFTAVFVGIDATYLTELLNAK